MWIYFGFQFCILVVQAIMVKLPLVVFVCLYTCTNIVGAERLPPTLPWFIYSSGDVDDLGQFLQEKVPPGHRNVLLFAREVTINSDIDFNSTYSQSPLHLKIVCQRLQVNRKRIVSCPYRRCGVSYRNYMIDLSGADAPDMISFNEAKGHAAMSGKGGCHGGSLDIYAKYKRGNGRIDVDVRGGDGGKGQDGYNGKDGKPGTYFSRNGKNGENGGNGGRGGNGGDAGYIGMVIGDADPASGVLSSRVYTSEGREGSGGQGGSRGTGGSGYGWGWFAGANGKNGKPGRRGPSGSPGSPSLQRLYRIRNDWAFFKSLPLTGANLQQALNAEMYHIMHAKHSDAAAKIVVIKSNIQWILDIAERNGYSVVEHRCREMLALCNRNTPISDVPIHIQSSQIRDHFDELKRVGERIENTEPSNLHSSIQSVNLLRKHAHYARAFHHLNMQFNGLKDRHDRANQVTRSLRKKTSVKSLSSETHTFLGNRFSAQLTRKIYDRANTKSYVKTALSESSSEVTVETPEVLEGLALGEESGVLAGVIGAEAVVAPEALALQVVGVIVFNDVLSALKSNFLEHDARLDDYERYLRERSDQFAKNNKQVEIDDNLPNPPKIRRPYLRPKRGIKTPRLPEERPIPEPYTETGKFIGVLGKTDRVGNNVVASFDSIVLLLTTDEGSPEIDLDRLDSVQEEELNAQLAMYRVPFSVLPSYIVTATVNRGPVKEGNIGRWFEFDVEFVDTGESFIVPITTIVLDKLLHGISAVAAINIPANIPENSIKLLDRDFERRITTELGLTLDNRFQNRRSTREAEHTNCISGAVYTIPTVVDRPDPPTLPRGPVTITKVNVANIGQGSCNILYDNQGDPIAVFDAGFIGSVPLTIDQWNNLYSDLESSLVLIISHWDLDHYRILEIFPDLIDQKIIVAPSFAADRGVTVQRVVEDIQIRSYKFCPYGEEFGTAEHQKLGLPFNIQNLDLRMTRIADGQNRNNLGAITACVTDNNNQPLFLFPGDASFSYVAEEQKKYLKYLIATHHGSERSITDDRDGYRSIPKAHNSRGYVIFSYGANNIFGHSDDTYGKYYRRRGWTDHTATVYSTEGISVDLNLARTRTAAPVVH